MGVQGQAEPSGEYTVHTYMQRRWECVGRKLAFSAGNLPAWRAWRTATQSKLRSLIGYDTMEMAPLDPRITEEVDFDDYVRQRVEIQTEPGVIMPMYVLIPHDGESPYSAVLALHGHLSGGKAVVVGCRENPSVAAAIEKYNYDYGVQLVRAGFITFCPDARGFGERQEALAGSCAYLDPLSGSCILINNMAFPLGQTLVGMFTWELHRLIDYVQLREDCRADRIGCVGFSGGRLQALYASALDERIACTVISAYMYGFRQALLANPDHCWCNYVPHLFEYLDMGDIAALIAPRPLFVETGDHDPCNGADGLANVGSQIDIIRRAYHLLEAEAMLRHHVFPGEHEWHGVEAIPWLERCLV